MGLWGKAFEVERAEQFVASERERDLIRKFADKVCRYGLTTPAILFLESSRPLSFIGSQGLLFFEPVVRGLFDWQGYSDFARMLERRGSVEALITAIEVAETRRREEDNARRHEAKRKKRERRKKQHDRQSHEASDDH